MPTNHQKTHQTYPLTPWDPPEVLLDPLDALNALEAPLDPLELLNFPIDLHGPGCLTNHQRTYQMSALTP